ncbi:DUF2818 family protein [Leeia aquatica]|uniref:DUF2818 family protein n=1 Tax=Leeia aquatica TaxID=2725557 RepID=A0A847S2S0_9NEIS|nr:DUF2818 family protein [Leeia aquatica]NLR74054.1 DUF2818 family protein [Leeia aquatica]
MAQSTSLLLLLVGWLLLANLPFLLNRPLLMVWKPVSKPVWMRVLECIMCFALALLLGRMLESLSSPVHSQNVMPFYVSVFCIFLVFGFPGFTYRYLWPRRKPARAA